MLQTMQEKREVAEKRDAEDKRLLNILAELGGSRTTDEDLRQEGDTLIIPARWTPERTVEYLQEYVEVQNEMTNVSRTFRYRPWDGAHALQSALKRIFGAAGIARGVMSFFGKRPPELRDINVDYNRTTQVPWGEVSVPLFGDEDDGYGTLYLMVTHDDEYGPLFQLSVEAKRKHKAAIEGLFRAIEEELRTNSIYRGKALTGAIEPEFLDITNVDEEKVIYSADITTQLNANLWALLEHSQAMREQDVVMKRAVLFEGDFGTGKTLGGYLTAQKAVTNGWTFLFCRPGKDDLNHVLSTARLYQPSVVFFEDIDTVASGKEPIDRTSMLLDAFDGIAARGTEIICVLTTNHSDRIVKNMLRPGRLSAVITFKGLDTEGVIRMIHTTVKDKRLKKLDYDAIAEAMGVGTDQAFSPAFVKEAIERTIRYAMARGGGKFDKLDTDDFVNAAHGLRSHLELMAGANEATPPDALTQELRRAVADAVDGTEIVSGQGRNPRLKATVTNGATS